MSDLRLTNEGDLDLSNGRLSLLTSQEETCKQRLYIKFNSYKGDWYLDINSGVPYFQEILRRGVNSKVVADTTFKNIINSDPSIVRLNSFTSTLSSSGVYSMAFSATTVFGEIVNVQQSIET